MVKFWEGEGKRITEVVSSTKPPAPATTVSIGGNSRGMGSAGVGRHVCGALPPVILDRIARENDGKPTDRN